MAYCGIPHKSRQINRKWVGQFIQGTTRKEWVSIANHTQQFSEALRDRQYQMAGNIMDLETAIRRSMTPDVMDDMGTKFIRSAKKRGCGSRFTGAGGGGCIWAIGEISAIDSLRNTWNKCLSQNPEAGLLNVQIDSDGLIVK